MNIIKNSSSVCRLLWKCKGRQSSELANSSKEKYSKGQLSCADPLEVLSNPQLSYQDVYFTLHQQAMKSILLHVKADPNINQLYLEDQLKVFCKTFGDVVYLKLVENAPNYFLVEFASNEAVQNFSLSSKEGSLAIRVAEISASKMKLSFPSSAASRTKPQVNISLKEKLQKASTMSEQLLIYFDAKRCSSDCIRKRLFLPSLFQDFFNWHMETDINAILCGSSFSSFSTPFSDVDISLTHVLYGNDTKEINLSSLNQLPTTTAKMYKTLQRAGTNSLFTEACKHIDKHLPGVTNLSSFDAFFPLIKLYFTPFQTSVDISFNNRSSVQASWVINMYTRRDKRVAPFLFIVRQWARQMHLTKHGGAFYDGMTPFMFTCLALFYLMKCQPCIIPPLKTYMTRKPHRMDIVLGGFRSKLVEDCTILPSSNGDSLEEIFIGFLQYYSKFDFTKKSINMAKGVALPSYSLGKLDITLPFADRNVGINCSLNNVFRFQRIAEQVLRKLEIRNRRRGDWGILSLINVDEDI